jgi:two-component system, sensor histidine kinase and response regulator
MREIGMATKILVIEDEIHIRENIIEILEMDNYEVYEADDGVAGVQMALKYPPDLVICDIMMDGLDGYQVLEALRLNPTSAATPFIFVTSLGDREHMRQGMAYGADDYLCKPFGPTELLTAVESRLRRQKTIYKKSEEKLEKVKQDLARMVTHELRTPVASMKMVMQIISRQVDFLEPPQIQEFIETLEMGNNRLSRVIDQMVFATQLETGTLSRECLIVDGIRKPFWEVFLPTINMARQFIPSRHDVDIHLPVELDEMVILCEPTALRQAFAEIIANALNFSPKDGAVRMSYQEKDGYLWISIRDDGPGIPAERLQAAMQGFRQIDRERHEQQGLGLGLMLARRIIEAHGGDIDVKSIVGQGTRVRVKLPIVQF